MLSGTQGCLFYLARGEDLSERLVVDLENDSHARVMSWPDRGNPQEVSRAPFVWPMDTSALEDLRWYLEDYLVVGDHVIRLWR
jgi:hypothetical protein